MSRFHDEVVFLVCIFITFTFVIGGAHIVDNYRLKKLCDDWLYEERAKSEFRQCIENSIDYEKFEVTEVIDCRVSVKVKYCTDEYNKNIDFVPIIDWGKNE